MDFSTILCSFVMFMALVLSTEAECIHSKFATVEGHTACLDIDTSNIVEKGISDEDKQMILDLHNEYRANEPAANMQKMVWDDEIAQIAEKWTDNCQYEHDGTSFRSIPGRFSVGQNLALGHPHWESVISAWYDEVEDFTYNSTNNVFRKVGHFTQLTWATTTKLGCAYAKCSNLDNGYYNGKFFACNYGPGGNSGNVYAPYKKHQRSKCEDCPGHCDEDLQICDCGGKTCENGGTLDLTTCTCSCAREFHVGEECGLDCDRAEDKPWCGTQFPASYCAIYTNVPYDCPNMCKVCPYGGIQYRESAGSTTRRPTTTTTRPYSVTSTRTRRPRITTQRPTTTSATTTTTTATTTTTTWPTTRKPKTRRPTTATTTTTTTSSTVTGSGSESVCLAKKYEMIADHTACIVPDISQIVEKGVSAEDQEMIVDLHNEYRANEPATNMQKMIWDDELAAIAERWADNCNYDHDRGSARAIPGRFSVGQNLALGYNSWNDVITGWYDEVELFTYNSSSNNFFQIGHYTQLTWATTNKIGCAYTRCSNLDDGYYNGKFWACNYGPSGNSGNYNTPYKKKENSKCEDCPGHCDEDLEICDCGGKTCENGGTLDLATCTCSCDKSFHVGEECNLDCSAAEDAPWCGTQFPPSYCAIYTNVPFDCPHMCGVCPYAGIDYVEETAEPTTTTARNFRSTKSSTTPATTEKDGSETVYVPVEADATQDNPTSSTTTDITEDSSVEDEDDFTSTTSWPVLGDSFYDELEQDIEANSTPATNVADVVKQIMLCVFTACFVA